MTMMLDHTGQRFGRLLVLKRAPDSGNRVSWLCQCDCGNEASILANSLRDGRTKSCGCYRREFITSQRTIHGQNRKGKRSPEYRAWTKAKGRCFDPNDKAFKYYGGRGITMCQEWRDDFPAFFRDMGRRPDGMTLERKDTNVGYSPANCIWASWKTQQRNRRNNHLITIDGETLTASAWGERMGISSRTIWRRFELGWTERDAIFTPVRIFVYSPPR